MRVCLEGVQRGRYWRYEIMSWIWAELQWVFRGQEITLVVIKRTKQNLSMCAHVCLSGVAQECRIGFSLLHKFTCGRQLPGSTLSL